MGFLEKKIKQHIWLPYRCSKISKKMSSLNVLDSLETLDYLLSSNSSIIRFGDGDMDLLTGTREEGYQNGSELLRVKMEEALTNQQSGLLVCIPSVMVNYSNIGLYTDRAQYHFRTILIRFHQFVLEKLTSDRVYGDAQLTRPYMDTLNREFSKKIFLGFKKLFSVDTLILVEGEKTRFAVGNDLFDGAKRVIRVEAPAVNAFDKYEEILEKIKEIALEQRKNRPLENIMFVLALGPTAKLLTLDLVKLGYRAIDVGHLDIEYEWFLRGATKKISIPGKYVNEAKDGKVWSENSDLNLEQYEKEIVARVGI